VDLLVAVTEAAEALATAAPASVDVESVAFGAEIGRAACLVLRRVGPVADGIAYLSAAQAFADVRAAIEEGGTGASSGPVLLALEGNVAALHLTESALAGLAADLIIAVGLLERRRAQPGGDVAASQAVACAAQARQILTRRATDDLLR